MEYNTNTVLKEINLRDNLNNFILKYELIISLANDIKAKLPKNKFYFNECLKMDDYDNLIYTLETEFNELVNNVKLITK